MAIQHKKKQQHKKQHGFTLLELIVTIAVLGVVTSLATDFIVNESNQKRFDLTKKRVEDIRYAIVGDDSRSLNSQVAISGFVTDMGELPKELRQLLVESYCDDPVYFTSVACTVTGSSTWVVQSNWRGPYLRPTGTETFTGITGDVSVYRDAWGTRNSVQDEDLRNFGWDFNRIEFDTAAAPPAWVDSDTAKNLKVQSLGLDRVAGTSSVNSDDARYETDYPVFDLLDSNSYPLVVENDYKASTVVSVSIQNNYMGSIAACLKWIGTSAGTGVTIIPSILGGALVPSSVIGDVMGKIYFSIEQDSDADGDCDTSDTNFTNISYSPSSSIVVHHSINSGALTITVAP